MIEKNSFNSYKGTIVIQEVDKLCSEDLASIPIKEQLL